VEVEGEGGFVVGGVAGVFFGEGFVSDVDVV